eukprot:TRINITY_DN4972_c0_g5_i1.p1 TRINITY_DN4972_c0_g5~~TRINITY_DN4972_c0_g5_i1.p1  ORF type:complete len:431 (+),score=87.33 TRINITY_DN4972_c0_g5_i1:42-1334(+)
MNIAVAVLGVATLAAAQGNCGCTQGETCCEDSSGYACCIDAENFCVPDTPKSSFPARCCPKWTVGCSVGSVGCCDPARPWQRLMQNSRVRNPMGVKGANPTNSRNVFNTTGTMYAIFAAGLSIHLDALTIEASGATTKRAVTGPVATWYTSLFGEATRVFTFDGKRAQFHFVDGKPNGGVTLYSIDAATGSSTAKTLKVTGYPEGFAYHLESDKFVFSVEKEGAYAFYSVNVDTGATTAVGTIVRGGGESDPAFYAGYISGIALDGTTVQRLGFQMVSTGSGSGLGSFNLTGGVASTASWKSLANPVGSLFYYTFTRVQGTDDFISLAPSATGEHSFQIIRWALNGTSRVLATLPNAHAPASGRIGTLGYIAAGQAGSTFGAVVIEASTVSHKWAVATLDLATNQYQVHPFQPEFLVSGGAACSGFGIAA